LKSELAVPAVEEPSGFAFDSAERA